MSSLTKAESKRLIRAIQSKTKKMYMSLSPMLIVSTKDMEAIDKLTAKWLKRIG